MSNETLANAAKLMHSILSGDKRKMTTFQQFVDRGKYRFIGIQSIDCDDCGIDYKKNVADKQTAFFYAIAESVTSGEIWASMAESYSDLQPSTHLFCHECVSKEYQRELQSNEYWKEQGEL